MRILLLGAYGFIGLAIARRLQQAGHDIVGFGRDLDLGKLLAPDLAWTGTDLATLSDTAAWQPYLDGVDAVVNASGALQDGARDKLAASQERAISALIAACEVRGVRTFIQISAPGADPTAQTAFLRTKGEADAVLQRSTLNWTILKPGLVIGANAYGSTALLRMIAALPVVQLLAFGASRVQVVALDEVADAVHSCLAGEVPTRATFDLVAAEPHPLRDLVLKLRRWLGLPAPVAVCDLPKPIGRGLAQLADLASWFGWRSPLRSSALDILSQGIVGDPEPWRAATGRDLTDLGAILKRLPSTRQERIFARSQLVLPVLVLTLAFFWLLSGLIGLWQWREAVAVLPSSVSPELAASFVILGSLADITIGIGFLFRRWLVRAALGAVVVSLSYLIAGTVLTPWLWGDPLGPFVKILPATALAVAVTTIAGER
ncbi:Nucleoside-diphosphate-sugar epimerase [Bosea sp. CRIB-10]|uniref:SDR family oxidoreductase n=1 Tax=Bosea sp. CRIB-10 TaxID=378404 RepID=UPI0008ED217E|nr:SDR family oxidoreductase [Bosea sp. CRIB-10]SFD01137.1 Nucleoside-diphosphate-sugar epimerase [Bosea sp. CRIB-10]